MFNFVCELSQPMGKTEFSSTATNSTNSVSKVRKSLSKMGSTLKELTTNEMGGKNENYRVASPESTLIHFKKCKMTLFGEAL